ncbi:hypothetical protein Salat_1711400 [Sesamum alatum]|uniref:Reverse transcriptase zinc-binding domain-containing protein n=1 Tax=Sesamum alatum TaxID=300844 RepID=A0AAE1Y7U3_9LAMI|nr:hypothetical protein Salat_1711400 [Sesamum alatum]
MHWWLVFFMVCKVAHLYENLAEHSSSPCTGGWSFLWRARLPGHIKHFGWRLSSNALPVCSNLLRRPIELKNLHPICGCWGEDEEHSILWCSYARQCWALIDTPWAVTSVWNGSAEQWLRRLYDQEQFQLALTLAWGIWGHRNRLFFEGVEQSPVYLVQFVLKWISN